MARKTTNEKLSDKECKHCGNGFQGRPNKHYCSDKCATAARVAKHRETKKTTCKVRRYVKKAHKFLQTSYGRWLCTQLKRAETVQVLQGHTAESLHELYRLKRLCSSASGYVEGKPTGNYHISHIWSVKADNGRIGLLHPENLVIAPRAFNLAHGAKQPTRLGVGLFIPTSTLLAKHEISAHDTTEQVFLKVRRLLGHEWTAFISTLTIQQTQEKQLRAKLNKLEIPAPANMSLDELKQLAKSREVLYFSASLPASDSLTVALSELTRFGHNAGEFSIYHRWIQHLWDILHDWDGKWHLSDDELVVASCLINETWAILHGVDLPKRTKQEQEALLLFEDAKTRTKELETEKELSANEAEEEWIL